MNHRSFFYAQNRKGEKMKQKLDFSKLDLLVNHYEMTAEAIKWEKSRQLFIDITEGWTSQEDIDYSIPISALVELIENTADFISEKQEFSETLDEVSKKIMDSRPVRIRPRLL